MGFKGCNQRAGLYLSCYIRSPVFFPFLNPNIKYMINPIKGTDAIIHHNAFFPTVPKSFWATSTTAQMVPKKKGTHNPTKITIVFKPIGSANA